MRESFDIDRLAADAVALDDGLQTLGDDITAASGLAGARVVAKPYQGRAAVLLSLAFLIIAPAAMAAQDAFQEAMPKAVRQMNLHPKTKPGSS